MTAKHHPYILWHFTSHTLRLLVKKDVLCVKGHGVSRIGTAMHAVGVKVSFVVKSCSFIVVVE